MNEQIGGVFPAAIVVTAGFLASCASPHEASKYPSLARAEAPLPQSLNYPAVRRGDLSDDYHGVRVTDPYRELEALDAQNTRQFVEAQNAIARPYLEAIPARERIKRRLTQLWNYERYELPVKEGGRYFYRRNDGLQNQAVLYVSDSLHASPRVLIDPNLLSGDGTVAMSGFSVSRDGKRVVYGLSDGGADWKVWRVRDVTTGRDLPDEVKYTKFTKPSWSPSGHGFYYSRYPSGADGRGDDSKQAAIYFHKLGTSQAVDQLIYAISDHPTRVPYGIVSEDGRYLIVDIFDGFAVNGISYFDLSNAPSGSPGHKDATPVQLFDEWNAHFEFLGNKGTELYFKSTLQAPNGSIVAIDVKGMKNDKSCSCARKPPIRTIVAEAPEALTGASYIGGRILASYLRNARSEVRVFDPDGRQLGEVKLPGLGSTAGFRGYSTDTETFYAYGDYLSPPALYRYDVAANVSQVFRKPPVSVDLSGYVTDQVFYSSKDGTRVPMFITRRRGITKDGRNAVLLYGYGGFKVSGTPRYSAAVIAWLEMGGIYAVANIRGGGEYGAAWHEAGTRLNKQNVFDDFIAAGEYLVAHRYTSPERLAISGASNGGLLVATTLIQRPDLFGAALPDVGVLDMLRYQTASANARAWSSDYGLSEVPDEFTALLAYSPYHNLRQTRCYPPTLVTTADHDDRVAPWHSYKFAAALQYAQSCANPVLLRVETRAGHGAGKPTWMQIEGVADQLAFLVKPLGMETADSVLD